MASILSPAGLMDQRDRERLVGDVEQSGAQFNPVQSPVVAQVDQLRGSDDFQARLNTLKKLPSTIPQMTQETKDVYGKYNRFLKFAGATTGDYSGSSAFQSGLSAALDMDMIQDLLEEQRENTFARQFDEMLPFLKSRKDVTKFALGTGANLKETAKAQDVWMNSRFDMGYANQVEDFRDAVQKRNTNTALGFAVNLIETIEQKEGRELTAPDQRAVIQDALFGNDPATGKPRIALDKTNVQDLLTGLDSILQTSGGITATSSYITFTHKFPDDKGTQELLKQIGIRKDQYRTKGGEIIVNPRTQFPVNQTDPGTALALQKLQTRGASWYPYNPSGGTMMRLRNRTTGVEMLEPFNSSNVGVMEQMRRYADRNNAEIIPDMTPSDWNAARYNIPVAELGHYQGQYNAANRIKQAAEDGLILVQEGGAGGIEGKVKYTLTHVQNWAADLAGVAKELQVVESTDDRGNLVSRQETEVERDKRISNAVLNDALQIANEVIYAGSEDLAKNPQGLSEQRNMKVATKLKDDIDKELRNLPKDQYSAQIYLRFLEVSMRAQVARMHIEKDRMLASFYVAMTGAIDLTGWLQTTGGATSILNAVKHQAERIAREKLELITPKADSPARQDPYGTPYQEGEQPQYDVPGGAANMSKEQLEALFQQTYGGG